MSTLSLGCGSSLFAVRRLTLTNYRNYEYMRLYTGARPVIVTGANGVGKTNLLEAISLLTPGRGLRNMRLSDILYYGSEGSSWGVAATMETSESSVELATGMDGKHLRRVVLVDGKVRSQNVLAKHSAIMWLTPQMEYIFLGSGSMRRRFFDRLVFLLIPSHAFYVNRYNRALRERMKVLRERGGDEEWLTSIEYVIATTAVVISLARLDMIRQINEWCRDNFLRFPRVRILVECGTEYALMQLSSVEVERGIRVQLRDSRQSDAERGTTSTGPHRSEMKVAMCGRDGVFREVSGYSTGEQKLVLISLLLAHARIIAQRRGGVPILLLDEVAAHLDMYYREVLFEEILSLGMQAWITGTEERLFSSFFGYADRFSVEFCQANKGPIIHALA